MQNGCAPFAEGDLVRLHAGGPLMTVRFPVEHLVLCAWFDNHGVVRRGTFEPRNLQLVHRELLLSVRVLRQLARKWPFVAVLRT